MIFFGINCEKMIKYKELRLHDQNPIEFVRDAFQYNIEMGQFNKGLIYSLMKDMNVLAYFGQVFNSYSDQTFRIYKQLKEDEFDPDKTSFIYYAVDKSGLVHRRVFGPSSEFSKKTENSKNKLFGSFEGEAFKKYAYECIDNLNPKSNDDFDTINIDTIKEYLPLKPAKKFTRNLDFYWETIDEDDNIHFGPLIYKSDNRSFNLPIIELVRKHLEIELYNLYYYHLTIDTNVTEECIMVRIKYYWRTRKHNHYKYWISKISYEDFSLFDVKMVGEESEYDW